MTLNKTEINRNKKQKNIFFIVLRFSSSLRLFWTSLNYSAVIAIISDIFQRRKRWRNSVDPDLLALPGSL